jgi:hypothetical protein
MVHEWDELSLSAPWRLHRFSVDEYRRLIDAGILATPRDCQLLDGVVMRLRPGRSRNDGVPNEVRPFTCSARRAIRRERKEHEETQG